ncbi:hypothetical protein [Peribacillus cavernae]|uniref:hypothetical protein n=1 Tax=Peribacillus cavernae TaxID=1674310 RepID=UPI0026C2CF22|nr:hypothetical protein [Peribacillus cavernae]MDQ0220143.1 hypothetical protein [Peribacillus cavernae]
MTKKKGIFDFSIKTELLKPKQEQQISKGMSAEKALEMIQRQMKLNGYRERTLKDYDVIFNHFLQETNTEYLEDITVNTIYSWLDGMKYLLQLKVHD